MTEGNTSSRETSNGNSVFSPNTGDTTGTVGDGEFSAVLFEGRGLLGVELGVHLAGELGEGA